MDRNTCGCKVLWQFLTNTLPPTHRASAHTATKNNNAIDFFSHIVSLCIFTELINLNGERVIFIHLVSWCVDRVTKGSSDGNQNKNNKCFLSVWQICRCVLLGNEIVNLFYRSCLSWGVRVWVCIVVFVDFVQPKIVIHNGQSFILSETHKMRNQSFVTQYIIIL